MGLVCWVGVLGYMEENFVGKWLFVCDGIMWVRGLGYWLGLKGRRGEI